MDSSPFFRIGLEENGLGELAGVHVDSSLREAATIRLTPELYRDDFVNAGGIVRVIEF